MEKSEEKEAEEEGRERRGQATKSCKIIKAEKKFKGQIKDKIKAKKDNKIK